MFHISDISRLKISKMKCLVDHLRQMQEDFASFTNKFYHAKLFQDFENIVHTCSYWFYKGLYGCLTIGLWAH